MHRNLPVSRNVVLASIFWTATLLAQLDTGTVTVTVRDPSGSFIPNATVTLRNENTGKAPAPASQMIREHSRRL